MTLENYMKFTSQCLQIMLYWNTALLFLRKFYCCIQATIEETSGWNRQYSQPKPKIITLSPFTENVCLPLDYINLPIPFPTFYFNGLAPSFLNFYLCLDLGVWQVFWDRGQSLAVETQF